MWSRRFLLRGLASAVAAAALALTLLWLLLAAFEWTHPREPLHVTALVVFAGPGLLIYPSCWYALVFRRRRYGARDTWKLIAASYLACCLFDFVILSGFYLYQGALTAAPALIKSHSPAPLAYLLAPIGVAAFTLIFAVLLAIPYLAIAAPVAFLHRAILLALFAPTREAA